MQRYVIVDPADQRLGTCGIGRLPTGAPEIFYALLPTARGRGAATEATRHLPRGRSPTAMSWLPWKPLRAMVRASERVARRAAFAPTERYRGEHRGEPVWVTRWLKHATGVRAPVEICAPAAEGSIAE